MRCEQCVIIIIIIITTKVGIAGLGHPIGPNTPTQNIPIERKWRKDKKGVSH